MQSTTQSKSENHDDLSIIYPPLRLVNQISTITTCPSDIHHCDWSIRYQPLRLSIRYIPSRLSIKYLPLRLVHQISTITTFRQISIITTLHDINSYSRHFQYQTDSYPRYFKVTSIDVKKKTIERYNQSHIILSKKKWQDLDFQHHILSQKRNATIKKNIIYFKFSTSF